MVVEQNSQAKHAAYNMHGQQLNVGQGSLEAGG
jgi:hypothetical protein